MDGVAKRYKTSQRRDWSVVPLPKHRGDLLLPYMHYHAPRLIFNPDRCWSTNLIHAVRLLSDATSPAALAGASLSSAFALSAEAEGRTYGGGVLKLETKEAERVLVPRLTKRKAGLLVEMFEQLDRLVRQGKYADASRQVDRFLGIPHDRLITARASYVTRRRSVGAKPRRKHAGATLPESSLPAAGDRSVDDDVSGSATERRTPRPRAIARSL
jgi:adenine-specific DNA-methyltransferase